MAASRDDFIIAIRSAFLKKSNKQRFSLIGLIFFSIGLLIISKINLPITNYLKITLNEIVYRSSFIISAPEKKIQEVSNKIKDIVINANNENLCLLPFFKKADRIAIIKSSLLGSILNY